MCKDVRKALYASKICSYAQALNIIKDKSTEKGLSLNLGELARIWKGGCSIRASTSRKQGTSPGSEVPLVPVLQLRLSNRD